MCFFLGCVRLQYNSPFFRQHVTLQLYRWISGRVDSCLLQTALLGSVDAHPKAPADSLGGLITSISLPYKRELHTLQPAVLSTSSCTTSGCVCCLSTAHSPAVLLPGPGVEWTGRWHDSVAQSPGRPSPAWSKEMSHWLQQTKRSLFPLREDSWAKKSSRDLARYWGVHSIRDMSWRRKTSLTASPAAYTVCSPCPGLLWNIST